MRTLLATVARWGAIAAIAFGLVFAGSAVMNTFAQESTQTPSTADQPATAPNANPNANPGFGPGRGGPGGQFGPGRGGPGGQRGPRDGKPMLKKELIEHTAELTNLDEQAVVSQLRDGATLTEIATANGSTEQAVIDAAIASVDEKLTQAVADERITEEQKATMLEHAKTEAPTLMNEAGMPNAGGPGPRGHDGRRMLVEATAEVTGLTTDEVIAEVQGGKSLAQVAEAHGKTADDIIENLRTKGQDRLDDMLEHAREAINTVPGN